MLNELCLCLRWSCEGGEELYCLLEGFWQIWATAHVGKVVGKDFVNKSENFWCQCRCMLTWVCSVDAARRWVLSSSTFLHGVWCGLCHTHTPSLRGFLLPPALGKWFSCAAGWGFAGGGGFNVAWRQAAGAMTRACVKERREKCLTFEVGSWRILSRSGGEGLDLDSGGKKMTSCVFCFALILLLCSDFKR